MILLAAIFVLTPAQSHAARRRPIDTYVQDLLAAKKDAGISQEKYMWRIYHLTERALDHEKWSIVRKALTARGATFEQQTGPESAEVTIPSAAFVTTSGLSHRLQIRCNMAQSIDPNGNWGMVINYVWPRLIVEPNATFSQFVKSHPYSADSVLGQVLQRPGALRLAKMNPKVVEVRLEYRPDGPTLDEEVSPGRHWPNNFVGSITLERKDGSGARLDYEAKSGFDPEHDADGKVLRRDFVYSETIGPLKRPYNSPEDQTFESYGPPNDDYLVISRVSNKDKPSTRSEMMAYSGEDLRRIHSNTKSLILDGVEFSGHDYRLLSRFTNLESLSLGAAENPNGPDLSDLTVLGKLRSLKTLYIRLDSTPIDLESARAIGSLPRLTLLYFSLGDLDPKCLAAVVRAPKLESLGASFSRAYTQRELSPVWKKSAWKELDLFSAQRISHESAAHLLRMPRLESISLTGLHANDMAMIATLVRTRKLKSVQFDDCEITKGLLSALSRSPSLENLQFARCGNLSDALLAELTKLKSVDLIRFMDCKHVTRKGATKLASSLKGRYELD